MSINCLDLQRQPLREDPQFPERDAAKSVPLLYKIFRSGYRCIILTAACLFLSTSRKKVGKGSFWKDKNTFSQTFFPTKSKNIFKEIGEAYLRGFD